MGFSSASKGLISSYVLFLSSLSSLLPLFYFSIILLKLFFSSSIFLLTYFDGFFFPLSYIFLFYVFIYFCVSVFISIISQFILFIFSIFFSFVSSPFSLFLIAFLHVSFFPSTKAILHDKSEYVFSFKIYPHTNGTLFSDIFTCALCLICESCGV